MLSICECDSLVTRLVRVKSYQIKMILILPARLRLVPACLSGVDGPDPDNTPKDELDETVH